MVTLFQTTGIITQSPTGEYNYGDEKKIKDNNPRGNVLRYDDKKGIAKAEGTFTLGTNFGLIKTKAAGFGEVYLDSAKYKFNLTFGINANIESKIQERLEFYMGGDNVDLQDINYETEKQRKTIQFLTDEKDDKKLMEEFEKVPVFNKRPKDFNFNWVFSDVNFVYDSMDVSLRSVGKIGVAMVGKKVVNKKLDGYIEFQYKGGADIFTIYLKTGTQDWIYMEYRPGTLALLTSYDDINNTIGTIAPEKRKVTEGKRFYMYTLGSSMNKTGFVEYMSDKAKGIFRERPDATNITVPVLPEDSAAMFGGDSTYIEGEQEITPEQRIEMRREEERNAIQEMQMSGKSILSGPPPDRVKPKEEPKKEEPVQPETPAGDAPVTPAGGDAPQPETPKTEPQVTPQPADEAPVEEPKKKEKKKKGKEETTTDAPVQETPAATPPPAETPAAQPPAETPKQEPAKTEQPPVQEQPKTETPAVEESKPAAETPAQEQPKKKEKKKKKGEEAAEPAAETPATETTPTQPEGGAPATTPVTPPTETP
ncbi:MAG TPA: hypothetical protein PLW44_12885, partial [Chitinophagales bacterium]|nr:hypothetical protein [Chitinophagales bacterium]